MTKAIKDHLRDFVAVALLLLIGLAVTLGVLSQQQYPYPSWIPFLGEDRFEVKAELSSSQAVIPGQGQTVNIAGIKVGDVTEVNLEDGHAVVTMVVDNKYAPLIHKDATILLRPRTGLQDQTIELTPGTQGEPVEEGSTIPLAQTEPNTQPDKFLAALDWDTRAYLQFLLEGGSKGLGDGTELSGVLRRFEPTARYLAKINTKLARRRENIKRAITNFGLVSQELGARDTQLSEFIDSSNAVMDAFANQQQSIRETLQEFPSALAATRGALESGGRLSRELGPTSEALIPAARATGPALRASQPFFEQTLAPIRDQIRPFTRKVQPPIRKLSDTADALDETAPALTDAFSELNNLFNALAYNPPGQEEGYLFWASWLNHDTNSLFSLQEGQGPLRRGVVLLSCQTALLAEAVADGQLASGDPPTLKTLQDVSGVATSDEISALDPIECPPQP